MGRAIDFGPMAERRLTGPAQWRVTALATLTVVIVLVVAGIGLVVVQRQVLTEDLDDGLRERAAGLARAVERGEVPRTITGQGEDDAGAQVVTNSGRVVAATANLAGEPAIAAPPPSGERTWLRGIRHVPIDDAPYRVLSRRVDGSVVHVASTMDDIDETTRILVVSLGIAIPIVALALAALTWWLVGRMLDRVEDAARRQRRFVADASHELRSPLTRIRSELEVDLAHPGGADLRATHRSVLEEAVALERLVDDLLHLARSDDDAFPPGRAAVDLDDVALRVADQHRATGFSVDTSAVTAVQVQGDVQQLTRAIGNVVDNAARHARNGIAVSVASDGAAVVTITDDGPGIPAAEHDRVFERFARLDDARSAATGGAGLGLAIAREIVERHDGSIVIDPDHQPGTRVVIRLPLGE